VTRSSATLRQCRRLVGRCPSHPCRCQALKAKAEEATIDRTRSGCATLTSLRPIGRSRRRQEARHCRVSKLLRPAPRIAPWRHFYFAGGATFELGCNIRCSSHLVMRWRTLEPPHCSFSKTGTRSSAAWLLDDTWRSMVSVSRSYLGRHHG
jgi:hypothetical protein